MLRIFYLEWNYKAIESNKHVELLLFLSILEEIILLMTSHYRKFSILAFSLLHFTFAYSQDGLFIPYRVNTKWGIADENGNVLVKPAFDETFSSNTSRIKFRQDSLYGFLNRKGEIVIPAKFTTASNFHTYEKTITAYVTLNGTGLNIDEKGNSMHIKPRCGGVYSNNPSGFKTYTVNGLMGVNDIVGDTLIQAQYKDVKLHYDGHVIIAQDFNNKYGAVNSQNQVLYPFELDSVQFIYEQRGDSRFLIYKNGQVGALDWVGSVIAYPKYDSIAHTNVGQKSMYQCFFKDEFLGYSYKGIEFWK